MRTFAERLRFAMDSTEPKKIKNVDLAKAIGVKPPSVSEYLSGKIKSMNGDKLIKASKYLKVNSDWLATGKGEIWLSQTQHQSQSDQSQSQSQAGQIQNMNYRPPVDEVDNNPPSRQTPVISWVQAGDYTAVVSADLNNVIEWIPYHPRAGQNGFALIVKGASMEPMFNPDDRIYVNPTFQIDELHTGALVVMSCNGDTEATFKELVVEDGNYFLRPLNPNWQPRLIPIDHNCRLVGKVVGKFVNFE